MRFGTNRSFRVLEGVYTRPADQKLPPVRVRVTARVDEPRFDLERLVGGTDVAMSAEEAATRGKRTAAMKVVLRNAGSSTIVGNFSIMEPFHIAHINSLRIEEDFQKVDNNVEQVVREGEAVEVSAIASGWPCSCLCCVRALSATSTLGTVRFPCEP